jgi:hypothetical protein
MHRIAVAALLVGTVLFSQTTPQKKRSSAAHRSHRTVVPDALQWGPPPAGAIQGQPPADLPPLRTQIAVVEGDPSKPGVPFVVRLKSPDGEKIPPHWHPTDEHVTVLQGAFVLADGEKFSESGGTELGVGAYATVPKRMWHYGHMKGETILQLHGIGPLVINFGPLPEAPSKPPGD